MIIAIIFRHLAEDSAKLPTVTKEEHLALTAVNQHFYLAPPSALPALFSTIDILRIRYVDCRHSCKVELLLKIELSFLKQ